MLSCLLIFNLTTCADTVGDLGYAEELGNYAEYSGAPNTQVCLLLQMHSGERLPAVCYIALMCTTPSG